MGRLLTEFVDFLDVPEIKVKKIIIIRPTLGLSVKYLSGSVIRVVRYTKQIVETTKEGV